MKKLIILSTALLLIAGVATAQKQPGDSTHRHGFAGRGMQGKGFNGAHRPGNMAFGQRRGGFGGEGNIHLSEAQRQQMKTINDSYHKQLVALEANDKLSLGDYKTQLAALHKSHEQQIQGVYTDEQKAKMANFKKERQINMQSMAAGRMEKMKLELGLSDDQVAKLKTQHEQLSAQMKSLHENSDLLPEQKRAQMQTLMAQQKDQFKSVLTPEQTSKLDSMQKHHFQRPGGFQGGHQGWQAK